MIELEKPVTSHEAIPCPKCGGPTKTRRTVPQSWGNLRYRYCERDGCDGSAKTQERTIGGVKPDGSISRTIIEEARINLQRLQELLTDPSSTPRVDP